MPPKPAGGPLLDDDALELLSSGIAIFLATRDAAMAPESGNGMGVSVHPDRRTLTVYVPRVMSETMLANIADNGQIAVSFARPSDDKTLQIKGKVRRVRDSGPEDRANQEIYRGALAEQYAGVGIPRAVTRMIEWWPSLAVEIDAREVFVQTPGPSAGNRIAG